MYEKKNCGIFFIMQPQLNQDGMCSLQLKFLGSFDECGRLYFPKMVTAIFLVLRASPAECCFVGVAGQCSLSQTKQNVAEETSRDPESYK